MLNKKREEMANIEKMSLPTRQYLLKYVLPYVTEGLVEVAKQRPRNPVRFLARFMLDQANQVKDGRESDPELDQDVVDEFQKLLEASKCE